MFKLPRGARLRVALFCVGVACATTAWAQTGPIAHWKFDEGTGTSTADASGGGGTGTLMNSPTWGSGKLSGALAFSGVRYVSVGTRANLANLYTTGMTVSAWIRPASAGGGTGGCIVDKQTGSGNAGWVLRMNSASQIRFAATEFATASASRNSTDAIALNTWQHVAATWTGSPTATNIHLYVNGTLVDGTTANGSGATRDDSALALSVGNRPSDTACGFDGSIDDVRIYNRVLTASELQTLGDATPPSVPPNFTGTAPSSTRIDLDWSASTDNVGVTMYLVDRCKFAGCTNFAQIATPSMSSLSNTSGITAATTFRYRVRARDANNNISGYSSIVDVTTPATGGDTQAPSVPSGVSATVVSATRVDLSWTASTDNVGVTGYAVDRCNASSCTYAQIGTPTTASFSDTTAVAGTSYRYQVRARDAAGNFSAASSFVTATTPSGDTPPSVPGNLRTTSVTSTQIALTWNASVDNVGVTNYIVQRCAGATCSTFAQVATPTGVTFTDSTGITAGSTWRYRVQARDTSNLLSGFSSILTVTTPAGGDTQAPSTPTGLSITAGPNQLTLTWNASSDNTQVTGYNIERCAGASCTYQTLTTVTTTSHVDATAMSGTSYSYRVRARDGAGNFSAWATSSAYQPAACD